MHAGAVLDPGVITNISLSSIQTEFAGKVEGAAKLMSQSCHAPLTVMKLFSSLAAFSGSGGQGGYAAANGVLDAWAQTSQARSMISVSTKGQNVVHAYSSLVPLKEERQSPAYSSP